MSLTGSLKLSVNVLSFIFNEKLSSSGGVESGTHAPASLADVAAIPTSGLPSTSVKVLAAKLMCVLPLLLASNGMFLIASMSSLCKAILIVV